MDKSLKDKILDAVKSTGNEGEIAISYMEERLTSKEYGDVSLFFWWLNKNNSHIGHGNIDVMWNSCFKISMMKYTFTLKHDNGTVKMVTAAEDLVAAISTILDIEGCPERAIVNIKIEDKEVRMS